MKVIKCERSFSPVIKLLFYLRYVTLAVLATTVLSGCGSGGGGDGGSALSGTFATGAPVAFGTVTLKDSDGATATTTTDANGNYSFDVSAKRFPVMLEGEPNIPGATALFSAALKNGIANITPLTNLQIFEATDRVYPGDLYYAGDFSRLTESSLNKGRSILISNFSQRISEIGLEPTTINFITTPFVANGQGMDAVLDKVNVTIPDSNNVFINDAGGLCIAYGRNVSGVTFAINGMHKNFERYFLGLDSPPLSSAENSDEYVKTALNDACVSGQIINLVWTREPDHDSTLVAVALLKKKLRDANKAEPINIVADSWGSVIAYIALTELADPVKRVPGDELIKVNLITTGSPIQYLAENPNNPTTLILTLMLALTDLQKFILTDLVKLTLPDLAKTILANMDASVPSVVSFPNPIQRPDNVRSWVNFRNLSDVVATKIVALGDNNISVADCPASSTTCTSHNVYYFDTGVAGSVAPTLLQVRKLIAATQAASSPVPSVQPPTISATPGPPPGAFTVSAGAPFCDTNTPVGPAVKLTWNASDGVANYRVFRNGSAIGVQLNSSQLNFLNNLGLVAGQAYNYRVQAINTNGTIWSDTVQVTIPTAVCS